MADLPCPKCGEDVPTPMFTTSYGSGPGELPEPNQQNTTCPSCGADLYRAVNIEDKSWRLFPRPE